MAEIETGRMSDTAAEPAERSLAFWAKCADCAHCWPAAYYPAPVADVARIAGRHARCPKCNGVGLVARQAGGELLEDQGA